MKCSYHPTLPGIWMCERCRKALCPRCVDRRTQGFQDREVYYFCPTCNFRLGPPDISEAIVPFWKRLHLFFMYPFSAWQPVALILILAFLSMLVPHAGFLGWGLSIVVSALMLKYSFESLRISTNGDFVPPDLSGRVLTEDIHLVIKQIVLFVILFIVFRAIAPLGALPVALFAIALFLLLPAMIIILTVNDSLFMAINPVYFLGMAVRIGPAYLLMFLFLSLLGGAPVALSEAVLRHLPEGLQLFLIAAAKNYYTLVSYHLMGYVMFQYHERLNYEVDTEAFLKTFQLGKSIKTGLPATAGPVPGMTVDSGASQVLKESKQLTQEGKLDEAIALIQNRSDLENLSDMALAEYYLKLVRIKKNDNALLEIAPRILSKWVAGNEKQKSLSLFEDCLAIAPDFTPDAPVLFKIGAWLNADGKSKPAISAFNRLIKIYPRHPLIPKTCFTAAQIFYEKLSNRTKAEQILTMLLKRYPNHDMHPHIQAYLNKMGCAN